MLEGPQIKSPTSLWAWVYRTISPPEMGTHFESWLVHHAHPFLSSEGTDLRQLLSYFVYFVVVIFLKYLGVLALTYLTNLYRQTTIGFVCIF